VLDCSVLDHITIAAADFEASLAFYDAALGALGLVRLDELVDEEEQDPVVEAAAWGRPDGRSVVWLVAATAPTTGLHLRLRADSRVQVETFYAAAVQTGGQPHGEPRRWAIYHPGEFTAAVRDPQGNLIEVVASE
jgi:catechol 2,3-dioxygenase-like lactoylglutathione lyase family enzyme